MGRSDTYECLSSSFLRVLFRILEAIIVRASHLVENSQAFRTRAGMEAVKRIFRVDRREINYLRVTIESYDGMGVVKTIDPYTALIEVRVSPGCEHLFSELTGSLVQSERILLVDKTDSV